MSTEETKNWYEKIYMYIKIRLRQKSCMTAGIDKPIYLKYDRKKVSLICVMQRIYGSER